MASPTRQVSPFAARTVRFGPFEFDGASGELRKQGIRIRLQPRPVAILRTLLEEPGGVVTREELRRRLWPEDTFVDFESGDNTAVNRLRLALGDSADHPRYIETLSRTGYRFIGHVVPPAGPAPVEPAIAEPVPVAPSQTAARPQRWPRPWLALRLRPARSRPPP